MDGQSKKRNGLFARLNRTLNLKMSYKVSLYFAIMFVVVAVLTAAVTFSVMNASVESDGRAKARAISQQALDAIQDGVSASTVTELLGNGEVSLAIVTDGNAAALENAERCATSYPLYKKVIYGKLVTEDCTVYIVYDLHSAYDSLVTTKIVLAVFLLLSLVIVALVGNIAAHGVTKPIREMTATTRTISRDALSTRLNADTTQDELKELAEEINNMLDELQSTIQAQERFVGDASHELRTPISVIKGYASMLERWGKSDPAILNESIEAISKETENMQQLINNLLFLSRTEREVIAPSFTRFLLSDLVDEIVRDYEVVDKKHTYVRCKMDVIEIVGNEDMIRQLLRTIVDNAVKYTPDEKEIRIGCTVQEHSALIHVQDQGVGISAEELPRIFDRFYRADKARQRTGGYGLGMSIAKKIADVHHGEVCVSSKIGEGTTVEIYLPLEQTGEEV